ncbi:MAG: YwaF family protein [Anaerolineaceae bacterium]|nr:YwaF family protein [Anaerolineaceae bacterium]
MRPTWKSMLRVVVITNIYMVVVFGINSIIGSNYLYVNHKPPVPTLLDILPEWPVYLLDMEVIGIAVFLLLYLPFVIKDWRSAKSFNQGTE